MKEEEKVTDSPSMRVHYAGVCAFWIAGMWVVSWVCMLNFYRYPLLSLLSLVLYAWSVFMLYQMVDKYKRSIAPLRFMDSFWLSWRICIFAGMVSGLADYVYLRFIDKGQLLEHMTRILSDEQYVQTLKAMYSHQKIEQMKLIMQGITLGDMLSNILFTAFILSIPISLLVAYLTKLKKRRSGDIGYPTGDDQN